MKTISYILLFIFCISQPGRAAYTAIKKIKERFEIKSNADASDIDEESKSDDTDEKEGAEKFIKTSEHDTEIVNIECFNKHQLTFLMLIFTSPYKEVIIPPPEQA